MDTYHPYDCVRGREKLFYEKTAHATPTQEKNKSLPRRESAGYSGAADVVFFGIHLNELEHERIPASGKGLLHTL